MKRHLSRLLAVAAAVTLAGLPMASADEKLAQPDQLKPNELTKVASSKTGGRLSPMFVYSAKLGKFILAGGAIQNGVGNRHFDVEYFDPSAVAWTNVLPEELKDTPASGPVGQLRGVGLKGWPGAEGSTRIPQNPGAYGPGMRAYRQYAFVPESQRLYAYVQNKTVYYDLAQRKWIDTGAEPFTTGSMPSVWGTMCYEPVNKQLLWIGGSSNVPGGTPGTHAFDLEKNQWTRVEPASKLLVERSGQARQLRRDGWALLSRYRNRFHLLETPEEAKVDLAKRAGELADRVAALGKSLASDKAASAHEKAAVAHAAPLLAQAGDLLKKLAAADAKTVAFGLIETARTADDLMLKAELALAAEPPARGNATMVFDASAKRVVLFGGDSLDRNYNDTWLYDPAAKAWEQRWPERAPSPRAGNVLAYLPKSKRVAMAGGYQLDSGYRSLPFELWLYDASANQWQCVMHMEQKGRQRVGPAGGYSSIFIGEATDDDLLTLVDSGQYGRDTWMIRVDPAGASAELTAANGVEPGSLTWSTDTLRFERKLEAPPTAAAVDTLYAAMPANVWTLFETPVGPPHKGWSSSTWDTDRRQVLTWGGGHVTWMGTDVSHYSAKANTWSLSYPYALPLSSLGTFYGWADVDFDDRPQIPVHAYQAYAYDPPSGLMVNASRRAYSVADRLWRAERIENTVGGGYMNSAFETSPRGVIGWSANGQFLFDGQKMAWNKLETEGPQPGRAWCDGAGMVYDSKRDAMWMAPAGDAIYRLDLASNKITRTKLAVPKALGNYPLWREQVHIPDADMILLMRRFKKDDGSLAHVAFDPAAQKYYWVDLPYSDGKDHNWSWSQSLHYDAARGVVLLNVNDGKGTMWALKFDRKTAKLAEIEAPAPADASAPAAGKQ